MLQTSTSPPGHPSITLSSRVGGCMSIKSKYVLTGVLVAAFLFGRWDRRSPISIGVTTVQPFGAARAEEFNAAQSGVQVSVTGGSSGVGIKNVAEGIREFAMTSRPVRDSSISIVCTEERGRDCTEKACSGLKDPGESMRYRGDCMEEYQ